MMEPEAVSFTHKKPQQSLDIKDDFTLPFAVLQYVINSTVENITVVNRANLAYTSPMQSGGYNGANTFSVRNIYRFKGRQGIVTTINNLQRYFATYGNTNEELKIVKDVLLKICDDPKANSAEVAIEYSFSYAELKEHGKLYCPNTDNLICLGIYNPSHIHPFSHEGKAYNEYYNFVDSRKVSGIFVEIIDNESTVSSRFMHVAKEVFELPVHKDPQRASGVYFTRAVNDRLNQTHLHPEFIDFTEAEEKLGLYKNKEDAVSGGNPEILIKREHNELERKLEDLRRNNNILKEELKTKELQRDEQLAGIKHQHELEQARSNREMAELQIQLETSKRTNAMLNEQLAARSAVRTDYYEHRSSDRKDSSELIKSGLLVVTSALALYGIFSKNK